MKQIKHNELVELLNNKAEKRFYKLVTIVTETSGTNSFNKGKGVNSMLALHGFSPEEIRKVSIRSVGLTSLSYGELVENRYAKEVKEFIVACGIELQDIKESFNDTEREHFEVSERKNGTTVNGCLVLSSKDEHPMITVYPIDNNKPSVFYTVKGEKIDVSKLADFKKEKKDSQKQLDFGIAKTVKTQNYRFENIIQINMDKEEFVVIPDKV